MPNFKIFQDVADQARVKIYGNQNLPVAQDAVTGILQIDGNVTIGNTVTVTGTVTVGNTVSVVGDVTVAGTVTVGNTVTVAPATTNTPLSVSSFTSTAFTPSTPWDVLDLNVWTIGVVNDASSAGDAEVQLQVSPDDVYYLDDSAQTISPNSVYAFFSNAHMRYARVNYRAISSTSAVTLNFYYQGHT